jgi:4-alpha-glucanotransferase
MLRALRREQLWQGDEQVIPEYSAALARAVHIYLGRSAAALVTVQLEDMIGMLEPVNVPGTSSEYSNWTRRMTASASEILRRQDVRELGVAMREARIMNPKQ